MSFSIVPTPNLALMSTAGLRAVSAGRIVVVDGPTGCGKTTALGHLLRAFPGSSTFVSLDVRSTDKNVVEQLYRAVLGRDPLRHSRRADMIHELRCALPRLRDHVIVIDEAQHAGISAMEMIRHLHMEPTATWGLVLSGVSVGRTIAKEPMLASRVSMRVPFEPLPSRELLPVLHGMHPVLAATDADLLHAADDAHCRGVLRNWETTAMWLSDMGVTGGATRLQLEQVLTLISGKNVRL